MNSFVKNVAVIAVLVGFASAQAGWKDPRTWRTPTIPKLRTPWVKPAKNDH